MSKIIRNCESAPKIYIGDKHLDFDKEARATDRLASFCPAVAIQTDPDGARLIPILEVFKIEKTFEEEKQKARQRGYQDGHRDGLNQGRAEAEKVLKQLNQAINNAIEQRKALLDDARQNILQLVLQISRKVTFDAISADPEKTLNIIDGVINNLVDRSHIKLKLHPDHLPLVEQNIDLFLRGSATIKEISIEPDPRVQYGGCFIETPTGDIDARIESQFKVIEETILNGENRS